MEFGSDFQKQSWKPINFDTLLRPNTTSLFEIKFCHKISGNEVDHYLFAYKDHMNHDEFRLDETIIKKQC